MRGRRLSGPERDRPGTAAAGGSGIVRRRTFLGVLGFLSGAFLVLAWADLAVDRKRRRQTLRATLPRPQADGVSFHGDVILVGSGGQISALSARCPHLGCRIARIAEGLLVCPCHGSRFETTGRRVTGPAAEGLRRLQVSAGPNPGEVTVELSG